MRSYSLYLSTLGINKPLNKTNLAQLKWSINWNEIFGGLGGECRCRVRFVSAASELLTWENIGSLRASFQTTFSNNTNGLTLGAIVPELNIAVDPYLQTDTTGTNGVSMIIPNSNSDLYITCLDSSEALMLNMQEYQLFLYFDVDDNTDQSSYYPR